MMWSDEELDILESEWVSIVSVGASSVLAWAQQEEKGQDNHVSCG
jgi:hypothetical protein